MKNILILGQPRSGKSTLANMIAQKFNYQIIHIDNLRDALNSTFPELNINPFNAIESSKFQSFLKSFYDENCNNERNIYNYVLEGCDVSVYDCNRLYNTGENIIYFLAPVNISYEDFFNNIRKYDEKKDWTYSLSDEELLKYVKEIISDGKKIREECQKYKLKFVDTSQNRDEKFNEIIHEIENCLNN